MKRYIAKARDGWWEYITVTDNETMRDVDRNYLVVRRWMLYDRGCDKIATSMGLSLTPRYDGDIAIRYERLLNPTVDNDIPF